MCLWVLQMGEIKKSGSNQVETVNVEVLEPPIKMLMIPIYLPLI